VRPINNPTTTARTIPPIAIRIGRDANFRIEFSLISSRRAERAVPLRRNPQQRDRIIGKDASSGESNRRGRLVQASCLGAAKKGTRLARKEIANLRDFPYLRSRARSKRSAAGGSRRLAAWVLQ
jgi:hypothetical protein